MKRSTPAVPEGELTELARVSRTLGRDRLLVQAAGGNTSLKDGRTLWIKASGIWLAEVTPEDFLPLRLDTPAGSLGWLETPTIEGRRPSIEAPLHALMPQRVVVHVHSVNTLSWVVRRDGEVRVAERLAGLRWAYVPYERPGVPLAAGVARALTARPDVIVLGNHGIVFGADDTAGAEELLSALETRLFSMKRAARGPDVARLRRAADEVGYDLPADSRVHDIALDEQSREWSLLALYPDHVVFLGPSALRIGAGEEQRVSEGVRAYQQRMDELPSYIVLDGVGVLMRPGLNASAQAMLGCLTDVLQRVERGASLRNLTHAEIAELLDWDAEKYRQALVRN